MNKTYLLEFDANPEAAARTDIRVVEISAHPGTMATLYSQLPQYARGSVRVLGADGTFSVCEYSREFERDLRNRSISKQMAA